MTYPDEKPCACPEDRAGYVEILGVGDVALYRRCFACGAKWHRWPEGHYYRTLAERYIGVEEMP